MKINIPKSWDDITVEQFIELNTIDSDEFETISSVQLERLAIITVTSSDDEVWEDMDIRDLNKIIKQCLFLNANPPNKYKKSLFNDKYRVKSFTDLTMGEFIDIEYFLKEDTIRNIPKVAAILYRRYQENNWGNIILEPYDEIDLNKRTEEFMDLPITDIYGLIVEYVEFKNNFVKSYETLFEPQFEEEEFEEETEDPMLQYEIEQERIQEEKIAKWGWERMLFNIANGDILKIPDVTKLGLIFVFNMVAMKRELNIE